MLITHCLLLLIAASLPSAEALFSNSTFFDWSDFSNNFATDLSPLLSLFGESPTKQFLSESTSRLDSILFGIGPLGIVTTVVSVIRLYGNARWKSIIGRSQEPRGVAESELCSSTSADVCELWSHGGISRVFGRPKILAFIFSGDTAEFYPKDMRKMENPPLCGIDTPMNSLSRHNDNIPSDGRDETWYYRDDRWQEEPAKFRATDPRTGGFAPNPNMTLNIGIRQVSPLVQILVVWFSLALQGGFLGFAYWATYKQLVFYDSGEGQSPTTWAFTLTIMGTCLLNIGMGLCAWLVDEKSCERRFTRKEGDAHGGGRVFWLQPGGQRAGDQLFNAFAYNDTSKPAKYITSWRVENEGSFKDHMTAYIAVSMTMLGWAMQFVGLRGVPDVISLYLLVMTVIMALIRAVIRSTRLENEKNDLHQAGRGIEGHELDWQALSLVEHSSCGPAIPATAESLLSSVSLESMRWWHIEEVLSHQDLSAKPKSHDLSLVNDKLWDCASEVLARDWIIEKEGLATINGSAHAMAMRFRARLACLTSEPAVAGDQAWPTAARVMASRLQKAFETSADYIFSHFPLHENWKNASEFAWSISATTSMIHGEGQTNSVCFYMSKDEHGSWTVDVHQLEAALGLWSWSWPAKATVWYNEKRIVVPKVRASDMTAAVNLWVLGSPDQLRSFDYNLRSPSLLTFGHSITRLYSPQYLASEGPPPPINTHLNFRTQDSFLQIMAQDLFTTFISRIANIMDPLHEVAQRVPTSTDLLGSGTGRYLGLANPHLDVVADSLFDAGVASRKEAFMTLVPTLALKRMLPDINTVAEALLARAKKLRRDGRLQTSEALLDGLFFLGPLTMRNRVLRQLGQIYRSEMRSADKRPSQQGVSRQLLSHPAVPYTEKLRKLGTRIKTMKKKLDIFANEAGHGSPGEFDNESNAADETVRCYEFMFHRLSSTARTASSCKRTDLSAFLEENSEVDLRAKALTLKEDYALSECEDEEMLQVLKIAIDIGIPELIEDLWSVRPSLIHKEVILERPFNVDQKLGSNDNSSIVTPEESEVSFAPSPLWWAIQSSSSPDTLESLLEWPGVRVDQFNDKNQTALFLASYQMNSTATNLLLQKGAVCDRQDTVNNTPLLIAARMGEHGTLLQQLLSLGAGEDFSALKKALVEAVKGRHLETINFLLQYARPTHDAADVQRLLQQLLLWVVKGGVLNLVLSVEEPVLRLLISNGAKIDAVEDIDDFESYDDDDDPLVDGNHMALSIAVTRSDLAGAKFLIEKFNADVHAETADTGNALMFAVRSGTVKIVKYLVEECGVDIKRPVNKGYCGSVLVAFIAHSREKERDETVLDYLLSKYEPDDINAPVEHGFYGNALVAAAATRTGWMIQALSKKFPNIAVNAQVKHGDYGSALIAALAGRHRDENVESLCDLGADVNMRVENGDYENALLAAVVKGPLSVIRCLVDHGADPNTRLSRWTRHPFADSVLCVAAYLRRVECVKILLSSRFRPSNDQLQKSKQAVQEPLSEGDEEDRHQLRMWRDESIGEVNADTDLVLQLLEGATLEGEDGVSEHHLP